jgi:hypothetical protein
MVRHTISALLVALMPLTSAVGENPQPGQSAAEQRLATTDDTSPIGLMLVPHRRPPGAAVRELTGAERPGNPEPGEHPLMAALRWANQNLPSIEHLKDYSARFVSRERINGKLGKPQAFYLKIRHQPFSVYMRGLGPAGIKGEEAIYVTGKNGGKLLAHGTGLAGSLVMSLDPKGTMAMSDRLYPITDIGILNLCRHMTGLVASDLKHDECEVKYFTGGQINGRPCSWCQVIHPNPRPYFKLNVARLFVDNELKMPTRYEGFGWPSEPGGAPVLLEEYTYVDLKLNNGFTDEDFSVGNPTYHFH